MSMNSATDHAQNSDDESALSQNWKTMQSKVLDKPSLEALDSWIEQDLARLELEFASFVSNHSLKANLRKSRGSSDKH
jgi:hypothetical protein